MTAKGQLYFDVNSEIPVVLNDDHSFRPLEVGDRIEYSVTDGWNGSVGVTATVVKISDKSITGNARYGKKSRLNLSALPDIDLTNIADRESSGSYRYTKKGVYVTDAATVAEIKQRNDERQAVATRLEAVRTAASALGAHAATRAYLIERSDWEAKSEATDIILARYASEIAVEKARIVAEKIAAIQAAYPVRTTWEVYFDGARKPLGFETKQEVLDYIALYCQVYGEDKAVRFGEPVEKTA
jgi:hypothetical protein